MKRKPAVRTRATRQRVHGEMLDSFDEELEMELDDGRMDQLLAELAGNPGSAPAAPGMDRRHYFKELFRLQVSW